MLARVERQIITQEIRRPAATRGTTTAAGGGILTAGTTTVTMAAEVAVVVGREVVRVIGGGGRDRGRVIGITEETTGDDREVGHVIGGAAPAVGTGGDGRGAEITTAEGVPTRETIRRGTTNNLLIFVLFCSSFSSH